MAVSRGLNLGDIGEFDFGGDTGCEVQLCHDAFDDVVEALGFSTNTGYLKSFLSESGRESLKERIAAL